MPHCTSSACAPTTTQVVNDLLQRRLHDSESTGSRTGEDLASVRKEAADLATERAQLERAVADFQAQQVGAFCSVLFATPIQASISPYLSPYLSPCLCRPPCALRPMWDSREP